MDMIMLGYMSYKERPNRFRQKVENGKKKKRNGKLQRRRRRTGKRRFRYDISSSEESYSDYERISEPDVKSESDNRENPFFDIPSPSNVEVFNDVVVGFTDNSLTNVFSDPVFREYPMDDFPRMFSVESEMQDFQGYSDELIWKLRIYCDSYGLCYEYISVETWYKYAGNDSFTKYKMDSFL